MEAISKHEGKVYPLNRSNVDTDQIIPKQFFKTHRTYRLRSVCLL